MLQNGAAKDAIAPVPNHGGAVLVSAGYLEASRVSFISNTASGQGGAIAIMDGGQARC